jgi:hypothetical protein
MSILTNIRTALDTRLLSTPGGIASALTAWDNKGPKTTPTTAQPYQVVSLLPATPDNPTLTEETAIHTGVYQVLLMFPPGVGPLPAGTLTQAIAGHFPAGLSLTHNGQKVRIRGTPHIAAGYQSGERYAVPISIRYNAIV